MATNFPGSLDALTNPTGSDTLASPDHAGQHANANDAIEALQAKVGVDSSAVTTSLDYKVAQKIDKTLVDAKGDLIVASAADTVGRLAVGATNGHVLTVDSAESLGVKWAAAAGMSQLDTQTFASSTTYTVVAGAKLIVVECIGAGGGGGGGARNASTSNASGGGGGAGGSYQRTVLAASELGATVTVTIGAGGTGGAGRTGSTGLGSNGVVGGLSRFGTLYWVGARAGRQGSTTGDAEGGIGWRYPWTLYTKSDLDMSIGKGGFSRVLTLAAGEAGTKGGGINGAGGGGGGGSAAATATAGGAGGAYSADFHTDIIGSNAGTGAYTWDGVVPKTGGGGTAGTSAGGTGGAGTSQAGGGGGGGALAAVGGTGGAGATPGGGGGGGGGANGNNNGGTGGAGGNAQIKIWVFG